MSRKASGAIKRQKVTHHAYQDRLLDLTQDVDNPEILRRAERRIKRIARS